MRRLWRPPRKSPTPQETLAARPRAIANTVRQATRAGASGNILRLDEPACTDRRRRERVGHVTARPGTLGSHSHTVFDHRHWPAAHGAPLPAPAPAERAVAGPARAAARRTGPLLRPQKGLQPRRAPDLARLSHLPRRLRPDRLRRP